MKSKTPRCTNLNACIVTSMLAFLLLMPGDSSGQEPNCNQYTTVGSPVQLTFNSADDVEPSWSPDGTMIAFTRNRIETGQIYIIDLATGMDVLVTSNGNSNWHPDWSPDGQLISYTGGPNSDQIWVSAPDGSGETAITTSGPHRHPDWSPDGSEFAYTAIIGVEGPVRRINSDGSGTPSTVVSSGWYANWSPDGSRIAFARYAGGGQIYLVDPDGSNLKNISTSSDYHAYPAWSPNGSMIACSITKSGNSEIYIIDTLGNELLQVTNNPSSDGYPTWSPSGDAIAFHSGRSGNADIWKVGIACGQPEPGSVSGIISADGIGIHGVPIDLYDNGSTIIASTVTDETGWYQFAGLDNGVYSVSISTPLGYQTDEEIKEIEVKGLPHEVNFELTELDIVPQQRSRGYWAHQLHKALQNKPKDYTVENFSNFANLINIHFNQNQINPVDFYSVPQPANQTDSLAVLKNLLHMRRTGDGSPFLKRLANAQLMALLLNVVSGKVSQTHEISADGRSISQAITYCDMLVNDEIDPPEDGGPGCGSPWFRYLRASFILLKCNLGLTVPSGMIPEDVIQIAYKMHNDDENLPEGFALNQNYPNPFNPTTEISFNLPAAANVSLDIFNVAGQKVVTLYEGHLGTGEHSYQWDASTVATGIYFYRLDAGDYTATRKMVLLK